MKAAPTKGLKECIEFADIPLQSKLSHLLLIIYTENKLFDQFNLQKKNNKKTQSPIYTVDACRIHHYINKKTSQWDYQMYGDLFNDLKFQFDSQTPVYSRGQVYYLLKIAQNMGLIDKRKSLLARKNIQLEKSSPKPLVNSYDPLRLRTTYRLSSAGQAWLSHHCLINP